MFVPFIIIISNLSFYIYILIKNSILLSSVYILVFIIISFGYGSFIPINYFPETYMSFIKYLPLPGLNINCQNIIAGQSIMFSLFFMSFFICLILSFIKFIILDKKIVNRI